MSIQVHETKKKQAYLRKKYKNETYLIALYSLKICSNKTIWIMAITLVNLISDEHCLRLFVYQMLEKFNLIEYQTTRYQKMVSSARNEI